MVILIFSLKIHITLVEKRIFWSHFICKGQKNSEKIVYFLMIRRLDNLQLIFSDQYKKTIILSIEVRNFKKYKSWDPQSPALSHWLYRSFYASKMRARYWNHFWAKKKVWHPWQLKKLKSWGPFWSYHLNSTANSAHLSQKQAKWPKLAVLFGW